MSKPENLSSLPPCLIWNLPFPPEYPLTFSALSIGPLSLTRPTGNTTRRQTRGARLSTFALATVVDGAHFSVLFAHFTAASGFVKLLGEGRALAEGGTLPVDDVYGEDEDEGDTDWIVMLVG